MLLAAHIQEVAFEYEAAEPAPALAAVYAEHRRFVLAALKQLRVNEFELDDALQEVFLVVQRRLSDYREQQKMKAWLFAISYRVARNFRRGRARRKELLTPSPPEKSSEISQHDVLVNRRDVEEAVRLLSTLSEPQRAVFWMYEIEQRSMSEVAQAVNCPLQTAYSRLHKARERLFFLVARMQRSAVYGT